MVLLLHNYTCSHTDYSTPALHTTHIPTPLNPMHTPIHTIHPHTTPLTDANANKIKIVIMFTWINFHFTKLDH